MGLHPSRFVLCAQLLSVFWQFKASVFVVRGRFIDLRCIKSSTSNLCVAAERLFEDDVYWSGAAKKMHFKTWCLELNKWEEVM